MEDCKTTAKPSWIRGFVLAAGVASAIVTSAACGWYAYDRGRADGAEAVRADMRATEAALLAPEMHWALKRYQDGTLSILSRCKMRGWKIENGVCRPYASKEGVYGWRMD